MTRKLKITAVYDNQGETLDRYTIYINELATNKPNVYTCLGLSENPTHPQGFSQFCHGMLGKHNGKKITFDSLPVELQKHALSRLGL